MKSVHCNILSIFLLYNVFSQVQVDTVQLKTDAIDDYLKIIPVEKLMDKMTIEMLKVLPKNHQIGCETLMEKYVDHDKLEEEVMTALFDIYTLTEIQALSKFYKSPAGKTILQKQPQYAERIFILRLHAVQYYIGATRRTEPTIKKKIDNTLHG